MILDPTADLVADHIAEAEDLWQQRTFLLRLPTLRLDDLLEHDQRLLAHLDAVAVGRDLGIEVPADGVMAGWLKTRDFPIPEPQPLGPVWTAYQGQDVDRLLRLMQEPGLARVAGWAFTCLTGQPVAPVAAPEGWIEPDEPDPDDGLVWPDAPAAAAWWTQHHRLRFADPMHLLRHGCQPERTAIAATAWPGFPLTAPAWEQLRLLA